MNQGVDVLCMALVGAVCMTVLVAVATMRRSHTARMRGICFCVVAVTAFGTLVSAMGLQVNLTPSVPVGIYRAIPTPRGIRVGMLAAVCPPSDAAALGRQRGYLLRGRCAYDTEPLLKRVVAVGGDEVRVASSGLFVDGRRLAHSAPLVADRAGRALAAWPVGRYRMARGMLWMYADNGRSWDSRYWGPISTGNVVAAMRSFVVVGGD